MSGSLAALAVLTAVAGAVGGWTACPCPSQTYVDRLARAGHPAAIAAAGGLTIVFPGASVVTAPAIAFVGVSAAVMTAVARRPRGALLTLDLIGLSTGGRRAAVGRELLHHRWLIAWRSGAAVVGAVSLASMPTVAFGGLAASLAAVVGARWPRLPTGAGIAAPQRPPGPTVVVTDRDVVDYVVGVPGATGVAVDVYLYRALAGWNLGLGLDAEQAAWAGQLARLMGLGDVLADPGPLVDGGAARALALCRAIASDAEVVVLDRSLSGSARAEVRRLAALLAANVDPGRIVVLVDHRSDAAAIEKAFEA